MTPNGGRVGRKHKSVTQAGHDRLRYRLRPISVHWQAALVNVDVFSRLRDQSTAPSTEPAAPSFAGAHPDTARNPEP